MLKNFYPYYLQPKVLHLKKHFNLNEIRMKTMKLIPILFLCLVSCNKGTHSNGYPTYSLEDISAINLQMS